jgi:predicted peptidase
MSFRSTVFAMTMALPLAAPAAGFVERQVTLHAHTYRYQVYLPEHLSAAPPMVLFLHGSGERGSDNEHQLSQGLPPWLTTHGSSFPAVVVIPQAPDGQVWSGDAADAAMLALATSTAEFHGDTHKTYLTGLSMGGFGSWELLLRYPTRFAAAAIICGGIEPLADAPEYFVHGIPRHVDAFAYTAAHIGKTPVWIFHGGADASVPVEQSRRMSAELKALGHEVRYTEFAGVGHDSWVPAYDAPALWPWMFAH